MPVIKSAKKKLKQDKKRQLENKKVKNFYKDLLKQTKVNPTAEGVQKVFSSLDKAVKKNIIHKNKAARLKSATAKLLQLPEKKAVASPAKKVEKTPKKASKKK